MAHYLIKAHLRSDLADDLYQKLRDGEFKKLKPFGRELTQALLKARLHPETGQATWEEEDYCSPPLAQERDAVLDHYFSDLQIEQVDKNEGWNRIEDFPSLWNKA